MKERRTVEMWVCGKYRGQTSTGHHAWDVQGVFDTEAAAVAACVEPADFVGPVALNQLLPHQQFVWPGCYYPLVRRLEK